VIILAGEILSMAEPWIEKKMHPRIIINGYMRAMNDALEHLKTLAKTVDYKNDADLNSVIKSCLGTKFSHTWSDFICNLALQAVRMISVDENGRKEVDIKHYCKIEKIPGGEISDSSVIPGVVIEKDITHPQMRRKIVNPRIILLDCNLEFKKSQTPIHHKIKDAPNWERIMLQEEEQVKKVVMDIIKWEPDVVITEKGISDEAQHWFVKHNVTALRRTRKSINDRIAKVCGATIVNRPDEIKESDIGLKCGLFEIKKIGDEYWTFITECKDPKASTIVLRGASKDTLSEIERNLNDAISVARNVVFDPRLCPGGGATEMSIATKLMEKSKTIPGIEQYPYHSVAIALEVIPRTLIQNCGADIVRTITGLRAKHASGNNATWGIDGDRGTLVDMNKYGIWEPYLVKVQTIKTAIEAACMLLRIDDIVSGISKKDKSGPSMSVGGAGGPEDYEA